MRSFEAIEAIDIIEVIKKFHQSVLILIMRPRWLWRPLEVIRGHFKSLRPLQPLRSLEVIDLISQLISLMRPRES